MSSSSLCIAKDCGGARARSKLLCDHVLVVIRKGLLLMRILGMDILCSQHALHLAS